MNKRTRVINAMNCKPVDKVPVSFFRHVSAAETAEDNGVSGMLRWLKETDMDFLCVETDPFMEYPIAETTRSVLDWKDLKNLKKDHYYFEGQIDRARRLADAVPDICIFYMLFTPFSTIKHTIHGEDTVTEYYRTDKKTMDDAMKVIEEDTFYLADRLRRETSITGFFVSLQNAEEYRFTEAEYNEYLRQWDINLLEHVNSLADNNIVHLCSWTGIPNNLKLWQSYPYKTVNWSIGIERDMNMAQARDFFHPGTCLMAGFDNTPKGILYRGNREEIREETFRQLDLAGQTGTILCADCSVQDDQSPEKLRWVSEACQEYAELHKE